MTITFGWWLIPFVVSVGCWIFVNRSNNKSSRSGNNLSGLGGFFSLITYLIFFVIPSLIVWLIWAILK